MPVPNSVALQDNKVIDTNSIGLPLYLQYLPRLLWSHRKQHLHLSLLTPHSLLMSASIADVVEIVDESVGGGLKISAAS